MNIHALLISRFSEALTSMGISDAPVPVARSGRPRSTLTITAPSSGAVTMLGVRPGMSVSAGQTLAEITGLNPIWLEAAVPEILAAIDVDRAGADAADIGKDAFL